MTTHRAIEFWFEFGSNYSYLSALRIDALARAAGVEVLWRPFLLGPIFRELGWSSSPFVLQPAKGRYVWRDMEREAAKYDLPWRRPSVFRAAPCCRCGLRRWARRRRGSANSAAG